MSASQASTARTKPWQYPVIEWIHLYETGLTTIRIGSLTGHSCSTVAKYLQRAGVSLRGAKPRWEAMQ